jgi:hypothetical protein
MKSLKVGPNIVVDIALPERCLFDVDSGTLGSHESIDEPVLKAGAAPLP